MSEEVKLAIATFDSFAICAGDKPRTLDAMKRRCPEFSAGLSAIGKGTTFARFVTSVGSSRTAESLLG